MQHLIDFLTAMSAATFAGALGAAMATIFDIPYAAELCGALCLTTVLLAVPIIGRD